MTQIYYIQHRGYCGNCLSWWRPNGQGYTLDLNQAWKVTPEEAKRICQSRPHEDIMWPAEMIDDVAARHVNSESLSLEMRRRAAGT